VGPETTKYGTKQARPPVDRAIGELAARQHGVVALRQLVQLGLSTTAVRSRVAAGRLHRVYRGIYAVGHPILTVEGRYHAAVLSCGDAAALLHQSAGVLWGIHRTSRRLIDVTAPGRAGRLRDGIDAHRNQLTPADFGTLDRIPCTTIARTLLDLADVLTPRRLERAVDQAEVLRLFDLRAVNEVLERANGRRGASKLRRVLAINTAPALTKSDMEELLLAICDDYGIPRPRVNQHVEGEEVDFHWPREQVIVETDSDAYHGTKRRRRKDYRRSQRLELAGWHVLRFDWWQLRDEAAEVALTIQAALSR
jgi:very-short-patch-repair endonuclease/predicted transcriptional regulator of viral defense system